MRLALPVFCCMLSFASKAQLNIVNQTPGNVSPIELVTGTDNKIRISNLPRNFVVKLSQGSVIKLSPNEFIIRDLDTGKKTILSISEGGGSVMLTKAYTVVYTKPEGTENHPLNLKVQLGDISDTVATYNQLCNNLTLKLFSSDYILTSFWLSYLKPKDPNVYGPFQFDNSNLLSRYPTLCSEFKNGGIIFIDNVIVWSNTYHRHFYAKFLVLKVRG